jgi:hypothetical protein
VRSKEGGRVGVVALGKAEEEEGRTEKAATGRRPAAETGGVGTRDWLECERERRREREWT